MFRTRRVTALLALALTSAGGFASAGPASAQGEGFVRHEVLVRFEGHAAERRVELPPGIAVGEAVRALRRNPAVAYSAPNQIAHASALPPGPVFPNDPGPAEASGGWQQVQWNFLPCGVACGQPTVAPNLESPGGINAPGAWRNLIDAQRAGGAGVTVAVVDTGIAYRNVDPLYRRSPDFKTKQFVPGHDFVENDDRGQPIVCQSWDGLREQLRHELLALAMLGAHQPMRVDLHKSSLAPNKWRQLLSKCSGQ